MFIHLVLRKYAQVVDKNQKFKMATIKIRKNSITVVITRNMAMQYIKLNFGSVPIVETIINKT